jgi:FMN phosphatase YigB (HAD superfamily)
MRILVDIDGTLRNVWPAVNAHIRDATGVHIPAPWMSYDWPLRYVDADVTNDAYRAVCGDYHDSSHWYPGAWDAMHALRRGGIDPVFCTLNPYRQARTIRRQLARAYGWPPHVVRVLNSANKVKVAKTLGAVGIIDDKPATLEAFRAAGLFTATINHEYNREVEVDYRFDDWRSCNIADAVYTYGGQYPLFREAI